MVRIFDLPPGGLVDGAAAVEVDMFGNPIEQEVDQFRKDPDIKSKVTVTESESEDNAGRMAIHMRPMLAVNIMRVEFPMEVIDELNGHIDAESPNWPNASNGLVGQINRDERSAQMIFPHVGDVCGEYFSSVLLRLGKEYMKHTVGDIECETAVSYTHLTLPTKRIV